MCSQAVASPCFHAVTGPFWRSYKVAKSQFLIRNQQMGWCVRNCLRCQIYLKCLFFDNDQAFSWGVRTRKETDESTLYILQKSFLKIFTLCINYLFNLLKSLDKSSFETLAKLLNLLVSPVQAKILADTMNACILPRRSNVNSFWNCKTGRHYKGGISLTVS